jgi:hypothetical protein
VFLPPVSPEDIILALLDVKWLSYTDDGTSEVLDRKVISPEVIQFVQDLKFNLCVSSCLVASCSQNLRGPLVKMRMKRFCTAWIDRSVADVPVFVMHSYDESEKCHCVSNYVRLLFFVLSF